MGTFAVILQETDPEKAATIRERITTRYPDGKHFRISDEIFLVSGPVLSQDIADALGVEDDPEMLLIVLRLNGSFSGRSWSTLWEWLRAADRASV